jgi:glyceraldehyde-3-phosphate dehydrogenase/erythrose-4-phosphate dehydrogenase
MSGEEKEKKRVAINGFGRIGKLVFRAAIDNPKIDGMAMRVPVADGSIVDFVLQEHSLYQDTKW